ncbi:MAG: hypothetical protein AAF228_14070 [Pseudomonadota bacterium]
MPEEKMTPENLKKICDYEPRDIFGGIIRSYQKEDVPKLISDLKNDYPKLFELLPKSAKEKELNAIGRKAYIRTCPPCTFIKSSKKWIWDGQILHGTELSFAPVKGEVNVIIEPFEHEFIEVTCNSQVDENTRFAD